MSCSITKRYLPTRNSTSINKSGTARATPCLGYIIGLGQNKLGNEPDRGVKKYMEGFK